MRKGKCGARRQRWFRRKPRVSRVDWVLLSQGLPFRVRGVPSVSGHSPLGVACSVGNEVCEGIIN